MYKEFAAGCLVLLALYFICRSIKNRSPRTFRKILWSVLGLCVVLQIVYNCLFMFPDYYTETISGTWRFGTFSENLLAYNDGWDFRDEILQPILKNRSIKVDASAPYYHKYFKLLASRSESDSFNAAERDAVLTHTSDFDFVTEFETFRIMDYVKDPESIPEELMTMFENETSPDIHIHMDSVKAEDALVCLVDKNYAVYILGEKKMSEYIGEPLEDNTEASSKGGSSHAL